MGKILKLVLPAVLLILTQVPLSGCGCGFDCNSNNNSNSNDPASLTLGFSDSLPEDLKQVVIEVESITLGSGADSKVINKFTIPEQGRVDEETFQIDLLKYRGVQQLTVIEDLELPAGNYSNVSIEINADGSYVVQQADDNQKPLTVSGGTLTIPGMQLSSGNQVFTVEFGLAQALQFESANERYLLSKTGIRIENNLTGATLSGEVDSDLFDTESPCDEKPTPTSGNRVYLYKGSNLTSNTLADVFTTDSTTTIPDNKLAPFAVASLIEDNQTENWKYAFGYMPAGDYTLAFSCNTATDDSIEYNGLIMPLPTNQVYRIKLSEKNKSICNLTTAADCK